MGPSQLLAATSKVAKPRPRQVTDARKTSHPNPKTPRRHKTLKAETLKPSSPKASMPLEKFLLDCRISERVSEVSCRGRKNC